MRHCGVCSSTAVCGPYFAWVRNTKFKITLENHQIHKTQTIIKNVHTKLQDLSSVAAELRGISVTSKLANSVLEENISVGAKCIGTLSLCVK